MSPDNVNVKILNFLLMGFVFPKMNRNCFFKQGKIALTQDTEAAIVQ